MDAEEIHDKGIWSVLYFQDFQFFKPIQRTMMVNTKYSWYKTVKQKQADVKHKVLLRKAIYRYRVTALHMNTQYHEPTKNRKMKVVLKPFQRGGNRQAGAVRIH